MSLARCFGKFNSQIPSKFRQRRSINVRSDDQLLWNPTQQIHVNVILPHITQPDALRIWKKETKKSRITKINGLDSYIVNFTHSECVYFGLLYLYTDFIHFGKSTHFSHFIWNAIRGLYGIDCSIEISVGRRWNICI